MALALDSTTDVVTAWTTMGPRQKDLYWRLSSVLPSLDEGGDENQDGGKPVSGPVRVRRFRPNAFSSDSLPYKTPERTRWIDMGTGWARLSQE